MSNTGGPPPNPYLDPNNPSTPQDENPNFAPPPEMGQFAPPPAQDMSHFATPPAQDMSHFAPPPAQDMGQFAPPPAQDMGQFAPPPGQEMGQFAPPPGQEMGQFAPPPGQEMGQFAPPPGQEMGQFAPPPGQEMGQFAPPPQPQEQALATQQPSAPPVPAYYTGVQEQVATEEVQQEVVAEDVAPAPEEDAKGKKAGKSFKSGKYTIAKEAKANGASLDFNKRSINVMTRLITWSSPEKAIPVFLVSLFFISLFVYFGVLVVIAEETALSTEFYNLSVQADVARARLVDYNEISIEYSVYSEEWMTPVEIEIVPVLQVIPTFEQHFLELGRVGSFTLTNNVLSVTIEGISVGDTSPLVRALESVNIVESVKVSNAISEEDEEAIYNELGQRVDEYNNLISDDGFFVNEEGDYIDEQGEIIVVEPIYDLDGNEIIPLAVGREAGIVMSVTFVKADPEEEEIIEEETAEVEQESQVNE